MTVRNAGLTIGTQNFSRDAVACVAGNTLDPGLDAPATPERVLMAVTDLQGRAAKLPDKEAAQ